MARKGKDTIRNVIAISDIHSGCRLGLCLRDGIQLDDGGVYKPSRLQRRLCDMWDEFWGEWVPEVTHGEPYAVVMNGDAIDGVHHNSTTQISHNHGDQVELAYQLLYPVVEKCEGRYYHIRGTEAHVGKSGVYEEMLAKRLGAIPNRDGQYARWDLWLEVGDALCHFSHHISGCGTSSYESTAVLKELIEAFTEAGRWNRRPPDIVCRAHRHRCIEVREPGHGMYKTSFTLPAWQLKTPFAHRLMSGRQSEPQIGGSLIRQGDEEVHTRHKVWSFDRPEVEWKFNGLKQAA